MDSFVNEKDFELLSQDPYTFAVLNRILRSHCDLIRANHQNLIMCHSDNPYPVWIWTPDGCADSVKEEGWRLASELRPFSAGYRFNLKHELAEYFMKRAEQTDTGIRISMQLFAYDCPDPVQPDSPVDGALYCCAPEDLKEVISMLSGFHDAISERPATEARLTEKAQEHIDNHAFFFWRNAEGKAVACCSYRCNQGLASVGNVYTLTEYRRKHYAQHLVYQITEKVRDLGYMPMLYTDADYPASNACYEKIGYVLRGRLCTIASA